MRSFSTSQPAPSRLERWCRWWGEHRLGTSTRTWDILLNLYVLATLGKWAFYGTFLHNPLDALQTHVVVWAILYIIVKLLAAGLLWVWDLVR